MSLKTLSFLNYQVFVIDQGGIARTLWENDEIIRSFTV